MKQTINAISALSEKGICYAASEAELENDRIAGSLFLQCAENTLTLRAQKGDYDFVKTARIGDTLYIAAAEYRQGQRQILLFSVRDGQKTGERIVAAFGKYDNITLCSHNGLLYLAAEELSGDYSDIVIFVLDPKSLALLRRITPTRSERACRPALASTGKTLFLAYESFCGERYRVMVRILAENGRHFSEGVEAGCDMVNDNTPFLFTDGEDCYLTCENSSPLFDDYVWDPGHGQPLVLMPAYGHGWRVFSRIILRKLSVQNGYLTVSIPSSAADRNDNILPDATEDAGEAEGFIHDGKLFLLFAESYGRAQYQAVLAGYENGRFVLPELPKIILHDRKQPVFCIDGDELVLLSEEDDYRRTEYRIPLQGLGTGMPEFKTDKKIKLNTLRSTPGYTLPERKTAQVEGKTLNLYWGDLHMHSNISKCSRHPAFHCTNIEVKNRYSRDAGGLDFCLLTDHETMDDVEWARTVKDADFHLEDNFFVPFVGYEWTSTGLKEFHNYGHYNILYRHCGRLRRIKDGTYYDLEKVWGELRPGEALTIPHHPGEFVHPLDWNYNNGEFVRLVEIFQVRGSYEYDGCDFDPRKYGRNITPHNSVQDGLNKGYHFGFTSGGEHEGVGITGVFAENLTRDSIFDALYNRRVYGTTSQKLYATFFADECFMGSDIPTVREKVVLSGSVVGTDDILFLTAVSDLGETDITPSYAESTGSYRTELDCRGMHWLYLRVKQKDGNLAWTSPVFFAE